MPICGTVQFHRVDLPPAGRAPLGAGMRHLGLTTAYYPSCAILKRSPAWNASSNPLKSFAGLRSTTSTAGAGKAKFVWVEFLMSAQLPRATQIGPGLRIPHGGRGVMIHPHTRIGRNATIFEWASIGVIEQLDDRGQALAAELVPPVIGDDVYIGCGASIFGPVHIGDRSRIGIGAVVFRDVPPDSTVLPAAAKVVRRAAPTGDELDG